MRTLNASQESFIRWRRPPRHLPGRLPRRLSPRPAHSPGPLRPRRRPRLCRRSRISAAPPISNKYTTTMLFTEPRLIEIYIGKGRARIGYITYPISFILIGSCSLFIRSLSSAWSARLQCYLLCTNRCRSRRVAPLDRARSPAQPPRARVQGWCVCSCIHRMVKNGAYTRALYAHKRGYYV